MPRTNTTSGGASMKNVPDAEPMLSPADAMSSRPSSSGTASPARPGSPKLANGANVCPPSIDRWIARIWIDVYSDVLSARPPTTVTYVRLPTDATFGHAPGAEATLGNSTTAQVPPPSRLDATAGRPLPLRPPTHHPPPAASVFATQHTPMGGWWVRRPRRPSGSRTP